MDDKEQHEMTLSEAIDKINQYFKGQKIILGKTTSDQGNSLVDEAMSFEAKMRVDGNYLEANQLSDACFIVSEYFVQMLQNETKQALQSYEQYKNQSKSLVDLAGLDSVDEPRHKPSHEPRPGPKHESKPGSKPGPRH